jgi:hypothetical protein
MTPTGITDCDAADADGFDCEVADPGELEAWTTPVLGLLPDEHPASAAADTLRVAASRAA